MPFLPEEIVREIIGCLPPKALLRFRSVSRSWRSLIDSKQFIQLHLHNSLRSNTNLTLLVDSSRFYCVDLDSFNQLQVGDARIEPFSVKGSSNGLVLLTPTSGDIFLWNPAIRKQLKLAAQPPIPHRFFRFDYVQAIFALGYDSKHDDYKVVSVNQAVTGRDGNTFATETTIYSLKSNSWKKAKDFPYLLPRHTSRWGIYLNGALHTVAKHGDNPEMVIMAFDLGKEEHREIPLPEHSVGAIRGLESVEVMGGCLAAVVPGRKCSTEIWLMKEYGVKQSWMKLLQLDPPPRGDLRPLAFSKSGGEVLLNDDGMCLSWYDLKKKTAAIARVSGFSASFEAKADEPFFDTEVVVGSLVWPCVEEAHGPRKGVKEMKIKKRKSITSPLHK
ncbi:F-box protein CPR1-like isoform X1 [Salvia splendens]|uniref:F-box protein CPR1-like isoform X1 n=1 Tax=Salvia splendens TaxID=180675 RepID=UPI001C259AEA|nr:F-box protein CPR1-like isoform X1 [Salvia splendens]